MEAHIAGAGIAVPYPVSTEQFLKMDEKMRRVHGQSEEIISRLKSFSKGTGIHTRHYAHPVWLEGLEEWNDLDTHPNLPPGGLGKDIFTPNDFIPPYHQRKQVFEDTCIKLVIEAAKRALADWEGIQKGSRIFLPLAPVVGVSRAWPWALSRRWVCH